MRDLIVSLVVLSAFPATFRRPLVGLLMFSLLAYMRLQDLAWGFARFQRWSRLDLASSERAASSARK